LTTVPSDVPGPKVMHDQLLHVADMQCRLAYFSCGDAGLCPGQDGVDEFDGGGGVVPGAVLAGFPDGVVVVAGSLDCARVGPLAPLVQALRADDVGDGAFEGAFLLVRGEEPGR
jgi:hypothetical protein